MAFKKLFFVITFSLFLPFFSFAQSVDQSALIQQLQKQVEELTKQITTLQQQLQETRSELGVTASVPQTPISTESQTTESTQESTPQFTKTLSRGSSGDDVRKLQEFLKKDKEIYPDGLITGYFGPKTEEALKRWQKKHNIEQAGILGPQTRARFQELGKGKIQELITEGAGASGVIPPGLITAPGIQKKLEISTTTPSTGSGQATTIPTKPPPIPGTCVASNAYCINADECSQNGYYWCRNSCYATSTACLGQSFVPPVQLATSTAPVVLPTATVPSLTPIPTPSPTITTNVQGLSLTKIVQSTSDPSTLSYVFKQIWKQDSNSVIVGAGSYYGQLGNSLSQKYGDQFVATFYLRNSSSDYITQTNPVDVKVSSYADFLMVFDLETFTRVPVKTITDVHAIEFTAQPNRRYVGFTWYADNSRLDKIAIYAVYTSPITTTADTIVPSAPTGITTTSYTSTSIALSWNKSTDNVGVVGYKVYRDGTQILSAATSTSLATLSYTDSGLTPLTLYYYTIAAYDAAGNVSTKSDSISVATLAAPTTTATSDNTPPTISNVQTTNITTNSATVIWTTNENSDSQVEYDAESTSVYGADTTLNSSLTTTHSATITRLEPSVKYQYRAKSKDAAGNLARSQEYIFTTYSVTTPTTNNTTPLTITIQTPYLSNTSATIRWTTNKLSNSQVEYAILGSASLFKTFSDSVFDHYVPIDGLSAGTTYNYRVYSTDASSNIVSSPLYQFTTTGSTQTTTTTTTATTTSSTSLDTTSRLAQILESLNNILNSLKLLR